MANFLAEAFLAPENLSGWVTLVGAGIGFFIAFRRYAREQTWKRAEFLSKQMAEFFEKPRVRTALLLLDYSIIRIGRAGGLPETDEEGTRVDDKLIVQGLRSHRKFPDETERFGKPQMLVRASFDEFLTGLEQFDQYVDAGLVGAGDLKPYLSYWLEVLLNPGSGWKDASFYSVLAEFIKDYRYTRVTALGEKLGIRSESSSMGTGLTGSTV